MSRIRLHTVGQLARRSGVSVRTLHHYDQIGLLSPAVRDGKRRRLYDRDSVIRLQQVLTWRTLGLSLGEIARVLDDPAFDRRAALLAQRSAVTTQIARGEALIRGIDAALAAIDDSKEKDMDMKTLFDGFDPQAFADEAKSRWEGTDAWASSQKRVAHYSEADWSEYHAAHQALCRQFAALAAEKASHDDAKANDLARAYAALIDTWFYPCDTTHLGGLADLYEADQRFRDTFDAFGPGTAAFVIGAFRAAAE